MNIHMKYQPITIKDDKAPQLREKKPERLWFVKVKYSMFEELKEEVAMERINLSFLDRPIEL
jgi:hypothetical protein